MKLSRAVKSKANSVAEDWANGRLVYSDGPLKKAIMTIIPRQIAMSSGGLSALEEYADKLSTKYNRGG